jgi:hypothetical protein
LVGFSGGSAELTGWASTSSIRITSGITPVKIQPDSLSNFNFMLLTPDDLN